MQTYLLIDPCGSGSSSPSSSSRSDIIASTKAPSKELARSYFFDYYAFPSGEIVSKEDYLKQMRDESDLNALENQSPEC